MFADKEWKFNGIETSATVRHSKYVSLEANFFIKLTLNVLNTEAPFVNGLTCTQTVASTTCFHGYLHKGSA